MADSSGSVRRIAWREICPWLLLFRTFRLSISLPLLLLATVGTLVTPLGWGISRALFVDPQQEDPAFAAEVATNARWPDVVGSRQPQLHDLASSLAGQQQDTAAVTDVFSGVPAVYLRFVDPFARLADHGLTISQVAYYLFGGLWNIVVWAFLAGAMTRLAAVQLGREERLSLRQAVRHAWRNYTWYLAAPLFPMLGLFLIVLPLVLLGLLMRSSIGAVIVGVLWVPALICAFLAMLLLVGLMFGWPLMWPTISSEERSDAFEAFSCSYSYTFQRPLHYLFFAVVAVLFGGLGWLVVSVFAQGVVQLASWAATWGAGTGRFEQILAAGSEAGALSIAAVAMEFSTGSVTTIAVAFNYSFFFCVATAVYLLLRREVDQREFDEVFVEEEEQRYGLPPLQPGEDATAEQRTPDSAASGEAATAADQTNPDSS